VGEGVLLTSVDESITYLHEVVELSLQASGVNPGRKKSSITFKTRSPLECIWKYFILHKHRHQLGKIKAEGMVLSVGLCLFSII
jgi:hypothetical protein